MRGARGALPRTRLERAQVVLVDKDALGEETVAALSK